MIGFFKIELSVTGYVSDRDSAVAGNRDPVCEYLCGV